MNIFDSILERAYTYVASEKGFKESIEYLKSKKHVLLICTSNRWDGSEDIPKSTQIARIYEKELPKTTFIDAAKLNIYDCEGNVSDGVKGNHCGLIGAKLKDKEKNPSGHHRCWASINNKDDELWKISKVLLDDVDAVMFFGAVRWGQANGVYQRLIERLTWLQNRHETFNEKNLLENIDAGVVFTGHNWNGKQVLQTQKSVLKFFGFNIPEKISWNWQWTDDVNEETPKGYKEEAKDFENQFIKGK